ncbi:ABC transporter ATP-binding protein [Erysipelothrix urinaevulpis]|uniref:ABC transporter ATP-binding protein n=1 Tax=Erysipelothrix urinaevulpis TaxID=2683717 RepID=UPI001F1B7CEF|nr:ABC transporter ATP-binding protein [Erysipelothrix urinaevulpis]
MKDANMNPKVKDSKRVFRGFWDLLRPYKIKFFIVLVFALLSTIFSIVGPKIMGEATTELFNGLLGKVQGTGGVDFARIAEILIWLLVIYIVSFLFNTIQGFIMAGISHNITYKLRTDMHAKINKLPLDYFDKNNTGDVLSLVTNDIDTIDGNLTNTLTQLMTSITTIIGILYMMFSINWQMTLAALLILPVSFMLMVAIFKRSQGFFKDQQSQIGKLNGHVEEMYSSHVIVKAFNGEKKSVEDFEAANDKLHDAAWKSQFFSGLVNPVMTFISNLGYVVVSVMGGYFASQGAISVGEIQSFIQYMRNFMNPIAQLGNLSTTFQSSLAAAERVFDYLDYEEEVDDVTEDLDVSTIEGNVTFDNVSFSYDGETMIINDFIADVKAGQTVAIVGPTGAGKTTLVKLLMRFYDVNKGSIRIDGVDIKDMKRQDLRQIIGMVLQDTWLYSGTIMENIRYGNLNASEEEVIEAAKEAQVDYFVRTLPDNYETELNEETSNVSQGQKQLLTIARAILADPKIMILDEATSSVDTRTEVLIQKALDVLMKGRTSFIIAHRLSTIRNADMILVMDHGDIVEKGNHEELLALDGFYASLYNSQFADMDE